mmetsp:Transcript_68325/g.190639  ORF Transcript_68325/g.190639 Transcript_68325/m.190639 type:complete len:502 (-) Transcript_68325:753-2258(-)
MGHEDALRPAAAHGEPRGVRGLLDDGGLQQPDHQATVRMRRWLPIGVARQRRQPRAEATPERLERGGPSPELDTQAREVELHQRRVEAVAWYRQSVPLQNEAQRRKGLRGQAHDGASGETTSVFLRGRTNASVRSVTCTENHVQRLDRDSEQHQAFRMRLVAHGDSEEVSATPPALWRHGPRRVNVEVEAAEVELQWALLQFQLYSDRLQLNVVARPHSRRRLVLRVALHALPGAPSTDVARGVTTKGGRLAERVELDIAVLRAHARAARRRRLRSGKGSITTWRQLMVHHGLVLVLLLLGVRQKALKGLVLARAPKGHTEALSRRCVGQMRLDEHGLNGGQGGSAFFHKLVRHLGVPRQRVPRLRGARLLQSRIGRLLAHDVEGAGGLAKLRSSRVLALVVARGLRGQLVIAWHPVEMALPVEDEIACNDVVHHSEERARRLFLTDDRHGADLHHYPEGESHGRHVRGHSRHPVGQLHDHRLQRQRSFAARRREHRLPNA